MGIRDWWDRNFGSKTTEGDKFVLKRQGEQGGMHKVMDLAGPTPMEELYQHLEPGIYALHKYSKGQTGFSVVWGPAEVQGEGTPRKPAAPGGGGGSALENFAKIATDLAQLKIEAKEQFDAIAPLFGYGTAGGEPKTFIEQMTEAKEQFESLKGFFGDSTSGEEAITYEGSVPIWLHPKLIPELLDTSLEKIERRLEKWGLVDEEESKHTVDDDLPDFPDKPRLLEEPEKEEEVAFTPDESEDPEKEPELDQDEIEPEEE